MTTSPISANQLTDKELREYSAEHLAYEISMFEQVCTANIALIPDPPRQFLQNILLESFAIHLRNLITFFYPTSSVKATDVCAKNFFNSSTEWSAICPPISPELNEARNRAHREVGHLTTYRISGTPNHKTWEVESLRQEIKGMVRLFCSSASANKLDPTLSKLL